MAKATTILVPESGADAAQSAVDEREFQDRKWGAVADGNFDTRTAEKWLAILMEEVGELAEEGLICHGNVARATPNFRKEAIQVAAVALAIVEQYDRFHR